MGGGEEGAAEQGEGEGEEDGRVGREETSVAGGIQRGIDGVSGAVFYDASPGEMGREGMGRKGMGRVKRGRKGMGRRRMVGWYTVVIRWRHLLLRESASECECE